MQKSLIIKKYFENEQKQLLKWEIDWLNILRFNYFHFVLFTGFPIEQPYGRYVFLYLWTVLAGLGITGGSHRLWSHGSFKANLPLRLFLAFCNTIAFQRSIYKWCIIHRLHHKFTDGTADPHDSRRGFFFSHFGWMLIKPHPDVIKFREKIDLSDLFSDEVVMFQHKYYPILVFLFTFSLPISILMLWGTSFYNSLNMIFLSNLLVSHGVWLVNSYAHSIGSRIYDKFITATESTLLSFFILGEGFHNYHHVFPSDYKAAEHNSYWCNITTGFIDLMAKIGWATNLKSMSNDKIQQRVLKTGDGSHLNNNGNNFIQHKETDDQIWVLQEKNVITEKSSDVTIINRPQI